MRARSAELRSLTSYPSRAGRRLAPLLKSRRRNAISIGKPEPPSRPRPSVNLISFGPPTFKCIMPGAYGRASGAVGRLTRDGLLLHYRCCDGTTCTLPSSFSPTARSACAQKTFLNLQFDDVVNDDPDLNPGLDVELGHTLYCDPVLLSIEGLGYTDPARQIPEPDCLIIHSPSYANNIVDTVIFSVTLLAHNPEAGIAKLQVANGTAQLYGSVWRTPAELLIPVTHETLPLGISCERCDAQVSRSLILSTSPRIPILHHCDALVIKFIATVSGKPSYAATPSSWSLLESVFPQWSSVLRAMWPGSASSIHLANSMRLTVTTSRLHRDGRAPRRGRCPANTNPRDPHAGSSSKRPTDRRINSLV
ncbi:hypothetical protein EVAR_63597_1 [Eumeta japonica]|uniref:Uncharacterized protein n=1 Tax=Eumeta variegata TaxID=151549 RepID=A0A4C1ZIJ9_EUMVA|nr:hypothetical protein EVAR_63597_1 [Eumeta japonica]